MSVWSKCQQSCWSYGNQSACGCREVAPSGRISTYPENQATVITTKVSHVILDSKRLFSDGKHTYTGESRPAVGSSGSAAYQPAAGEPLRR